MAMTLLKAEELWGSKALEIMRDDAMRAASLSDLAVLLGGWQDQDYQASDGKPAGYLWSASASGDGDVRTVSCDGCKDAMVPAPGCRRFALL